MECLNSENQDVQQWLENEGTLVMYNEYIKNNYVLPDYSVWKNINTPLQESEGKDLLFSLIPFDSFGLERLSDLMYSLPDNTVGAYLNQVVYLNENPTKAEVYEEGFHAIFDKLITEDEKKTLLKAGQSLLSNRLKKENKSITKYVSELVDKYPTIYGVLTKEQQLNRAFEEELASEFIDSLQYANPFKQEQELTKKLTPLFGDLAVSIARILTKVFSFFKGLYNSIKGNQDTLALFFKKVKEGKYAKESVKNKLVNASPATRLVELYSEEEYDDILEETYSTLNSYNVEQSQKIIKGIGAMYFQLVGTELGEGLLDEAVKQYFSLSPDYKNDVDITNPSNATALDYLKKDVEDYIEQFRGLTDFEEDIDGEMSNEFVAYDMSANEKDSLNSSYSTQLKLRIGKTGRIKHTESVVVNGKQLYLKVIEPIDVISTYYSFARALGNTSNDEARWNKLIAFASLESNPDAKRFVDQLMFDLFATHSKIKNLGEKAEPEEQERIKLKEIYKLYNEGESGFVIFPKTEKDFDKVIPSGNALIVNSIIKGFDLWRKPTIQTMFDTVTRTAKAFDANNNSATNTQVNTWQNNLEELYVANKEELKTKLENKDFVFYDFKSIDESNFMIVVNNIVNFFETLNFPLSKDLIVYSILNQSQKQSDILAVYGDYNNLLTNFKVPIGNLVTDESLNIVKKQVLDYINTGNIDAVFGDKGAKTRLKNIAQGNIPFDERIQDSTSKSADGKTVYNYQYKSYHLQQLQRMLENPSDINSYIVDKKLTEELPFLEDNYLFKKFNEDKSEYLRLVKEGKIETFSAQGLRQQDSILDNAGKKIDSKESEGVTIGNMTNRDFIIYLLNTSAGQVAGITKKENVVSPVFFGNYESSKSFEFIKLPIIDELLDESGQVTDKLVNLIKDEIKKEYTRISQLAITDKFETTYTKYNTGNRVKVTYQNKSFWLPVGKDKEGKLEINFGNFRGGTFSDHVNGSSTGLEFNEDFINKVKEELDKNNTEIVFDNEIVFKDNILLNAYLNLPFENIDLTSNIKEATNGMLDSFHTMLLNENIISNDKTILIDSIYEGNSDNASLLGFTPNNLKRNLSVKFASDWLNTMYMNQLMQGDQAFLYKTDGVDIFKRFKLRNASYVSFNTSIIAPQSGIYEPFEELKYVVHGEIEANSGVDQKSTDQADAQNYCTIKYMRYALFSMAKLTEDHVVLADLIENGEDTSHLDDVIIDKNITTPILKTVGADGRVALKKSDAVLTKRLTSMFVQVDEATALQHGSEDEYKRFRPINGATREIVKWSNGNYYEVKPRPEKKALHERRKVMEGWRFDKKTGVWTYNKANEFHLSMPISASKMLNRNVMKGHDLKDVTNDNINTIDLRYYGLQVETAHPHDEIPDPTQNLEIILNELNRNSVTQFTINGQKYNVDELENLYQDLLTSRRKISMESKFKELIDEDGNFKAEEFREGFLKSLEASGSEKQTLDIVAKGINLNHPLIKDKFVAQLFSFFSKNGLAQKRKGDAVPHISSYGFKMIKQLVVYPDVNGNSLYTWKALQTDSKEYLEAVESKTEQEWEDLDLSSYDFYPDIDNKQHSRYTENRLQDKLKQLAEGKDLEKTPVYFIDDLRHLKPRVENNVITGYFDETVLNKYNVNQTEIFDNQKYMAGVRIPTQDKHSAVNVEWVDMLPAYYGSAVVVPKEIVNLSGHDFDIDKLYLSKPDGYYKNGNFYQYQNTLEDLKRYNLENNKEVRALIREFKDNEENYYTLKEEIKVIRKKKKEQYDKVKKIEESFSSLSKEDKKDLANLYKTKLELSSIENKIDSDSATEEDLEQRKVLLKKIRSIYKFNKVKESDILNPKVAEYSKALEDLYDLSSGENKQILDEKLEVFTELTNKIETKSFTQLGLPINQSEFEEYIKTFGFSNKGFINNTLLQANQQALANEQMLDGKISDTPASMGYMGNGVLTEFQLQDGTYLLSNDGKTFVNAKKNKYNVHSMLGHIIMDGNLRKGKSNIGIDVNYTLFNIVLNRIGAEINENNSITIDINGVPTSYNKLELFLKGEDISEKDYYNSLIGKTFNTEEWGEIKIDEIRLDKDEFGFEYIKNGEKVRSKQNIFLMQSIGVGVLPMSKVEKRRVFDVLSTLTSSATDEAKEQLNARYGLSIDSLGAVLPLVAMGGNLSLGIALVNQPIVKLFLEYKNKKNYGVTTQEEEKIKTMTDDKILNKIFKEYNLNDYTNGGDNLTYNIFITNVEKKEYDNYSVEDLANGLRGKIHLEDPKSLKMLSDFLKLSAITDYGTNLIQAIKLKKGLSSDLYSFQNTISKIDKLGINNIDFVESATPVFIKKALLQNKNTKAKDLLTTIDILDDINKTIPKIILSESNLFKKFKSLVQDNAKYLNTENKKELDSELESFIYSQLLLKELETSGEYDELLVKYVNMFLIDSKDVDNNIVSIFNKFRTEVSKIEKLKNNPLIKKLQPINDKVSYLKLNQLIKLSDTQMTELSDAFTELSLNTLPLEGSISPMEFTKMLQSLYIVKDGMQFKFEGISKIFPVEVFTRLSSIMDKLKDGNKEIENNLDYYTNEFVARFFESKKHENFINSFEIKNRKIADSFELVKVEDGISFALINSSLEFENQDKLFANNSNVFVKEKPLKYVKFKLGKYSFVMKFEGLDSSKNLIYKEFKGVGTTNSTVMAFPMNSGIVNRINFTNYKKVEQVSNTENQKNNNQGSTNLPEQSSSIYSKLGNKTKSENVILPQDLGLEYKGVKGDYKGNFYTEILPAFNAKYPDGLVAYRGKDSIGNPFNWQVYGTGTSLKMFIDWIITGNNYNDVNATKELRDTYLLKIQNSKNKKILYYSELNRPSHATALDYLINKYDWNKSDEGDTNLKEISKDYGIYQIETNPSKEHTEKIINLISPVVKNQAYKENVGKNANWQFSYGLMWSRVNLLAKPLILNSFSGKFKTENKIKELKSKNLTIDKSAFIYDYHLLDQDGNKLAPISNLKDLIAEIESKIKIDMSDYDSVLGNIYLDEQSIAPHRDTSEDKSAINYPIIVYTIGNDSGLGVWDENKGKMSFANNYRGDFSTGALPTNELQTKNGSIYMFGKDGKGRFNLVHTTPLGNIKKNKFPPLTLSNGNTITNYTITLTFRRANYVDGVTVPLKPKDLSLNTEGGTKLVKQKEC